MKKYLSIIVGLCLIGMITFICFNGKKEENDLRKIRVAEVTHSPFYTPFYVAIENGYFKEEGLDIELVLTPGADKVSAAVLSNDVEIGFAGPEASIYVYDGGEEDYIVSFAGLTKRDGQFILAREANDNFKLEDLYNNLNDEKTKKFKIKLIPFIKGSLKFFNNYTNIELNKKLIVADVYELGEENMKYGMYLFTELFWDKIKINRKIKKAIYLDEIWRLIGVTSNKEVAKFIYKIFKTIRKYGGSSVAITQDISDLFSLENGTYGKSILNNSSIKTFFSLEEENIKLLSQYSNLSEKEKIEIKSLRRGECLSFVGDEHILINIEANDFEKEIIEEKKEE